MTSLFRAIIFVTGGAIIALELLASRIMTPYFGVSLYIWTGILSITLIALALGYWLGGRIAGGVAAERLIAMFLGLPAIAALAIAAACLVYPWVFYALAAMNLVLGAFIACLVLLFVPLVATSALNPLLIAIEGAQRTRLADAGAGRVLFISTAGSVAGVLITAFGLIPHVSNYAAALLVGAVLGSLTLAAPYLLPTPPAHRGRLVLTGAAATAACLTLLALADTLLGRTAMVLHEDRLWQVERSYGSLFGTVKVLRAAEPAAPDRYMRYFFQDGIVQNRVDAQGTSLTLFTYALEAIAMGYRPEAKSALMLGLGAGVVPMRLARQGVDVEIVEINPAAWQAAEAYFGFEPARFRNHLEDARGFVRGCGRRGESERHDLALVDLFQGDGTPEYLTTREFFRDLRLCLKPGGAAVFNTFADMSNLPSYAHLLTTLKAEFATVLMFRGDASPGAQINSFLLATNGPTAASVALAQPDLPASLDADFRWALGRPRLVDRALLAGGEVVTDAYNFLSSANARTYLSYRRSVHGAFPRPFLVN
ncbi:MAG: hypothetical protein EXQ92_09050 [Alphaproteobacteria bacterium]|nr:hypothetical protein [Alphaproteobacteria bacterium]